MLAGLFLSTTNAIMVSIIHILASYLAKYIAKAAKRSSNNITTSVKYVKIDMCVMELQCKICEHGKFSQTQ